jgi:16S rRNA (guanine966-N2)-methyltransferase
VASVRITAGTLRGRRLAVPPRDVRPTSERARQAFFNITADRIRGAQFLDLFAGSGAFSFEAVSRGAAAATAVESNRKAAETITRQASEWDVRVTAIAGDVVSTVPKLQTPFDVVYADPPYDYDAYDDLLRVVDGAKLAPEPLVAIEHRKRTDPFTIEPARLRFQRRAEYGEVWITFFA